MRLSHWCLPGIVYSKIPITAFDSKKDYVGPGTGAAKRRFGYDVLHNACRDRCMVVANIWMTMRHLRTHLRSARGPVQTGPVPKARNAFRIELTGRAKPPNDTTPHEIQTLEPCQAAFNKKFLVHTEGHSHLTCHNPRRRYLSSS